MNNRTPALLAACGGLLVLAVVVGLLLSRRQVPVPPLDPALERELELRENEAMALGALKALATAQTLFREQDAEHDQVFDYGELGELSDAGMIDRVLGCGSKQGYLFEAGPSPETREFLWMATAAPAQPGVTGERYFAVNHQAVVYEGTAPFARGVDCAIPSRPDVREARQLELPPPPHYTAQQWLAILVADPRRFERQARRARDDLQAGQDELLPGLWAIVDDPDAPRERASLALRTIVYAFPLVSAPRLIELLRDPHRPLALRAETAELLEIVRAPGVTDALEARADDAAEDPAVRAAARGALERKR